MNAQTLAGKWKRSRKSLGEFVEHLDDRRIPYLSHSKLWLYEKCPRCYHKKYILREPEEQTEALLRGQSFHRAATILYASLRDKTSLPTRSRLLALHEREALSPESLTLLGNAIDLLRKHRWDDHEVISIEEPFFMDLAAGLPPIIGIPDLVLRREESWIVVDHKTHKQKGDHDPSQLILYAEQVRRMYSSKCVIGVFDSYRLVPDLQKATKYPFQRIPVSVDRTLIAPLTARYRKAWKMISAMKPGHVPTADSDCYKCRDRWYY
jgi:hypothetical protein